MVLDNQYENRITKSCGRNRCKIMPRLAILTKIFRREFYTDTDNTERSLVCFCKMLNIQRDMRIESQQEIDNNVIGRYK